MYRRYGAAGGASTSAGAGSAGGSSSLGAGGGGSSSHTPQHQSFGNERKRVAPKHTKSNDGLMGAFYSPPPGASIAIANGNNNYDQNSGASNAGEGNKAGGKLASALCLDACMSNDGSFDADDGDRHPAGGGSSKRTKSAATKAYRGQNRIIALLLVLVLLLLVGLGGLGYVVFTQQQQQQVSSATTGLSDSERTTAGADGQQPEEKRKGTDQDRDKDKAEKEDAATEARQQQRELLDQLHKLEDKLENSDRKESHTTQILQDLKKQLEQATAENKKLAETIEKQRKEQQKEQLQQNQLRGSSTQNKEELERLERQIEHMDTVRFRMQQGIQQLSRALLDEKYGKGPHYVEMTLRIQDKEYANVQDKDRVVIELASNDLMPHTKLWFLEQVSRGLYDGCSFYRNAGHIVQAGPVASDVLPRKYTARQLDDRFARSEYRSVLFQEYSESHPHSRYTVGYAGRPGGPDIYINVQDNTKIHGPGGQGQYDEYEKGEADPCFGAVVKGRDLVDEIHRIPTKMDDAVGVPILMERLVAIESARLLPPNARLVKDPLEQ